MCGFTAAATPAKGSFIASQSCDMYQSKRKGTNSGSLESTLGETYPIIEVDAQEAQQVNWVRVKTTYNPSSDRWVSASCGDLHLAWGDLQSKVYSGQADNEFIVELRPGKFYELTADKSMSVIELKDWQFQKVR